MTAATEARIARGAAWSAVESWGRHILTFMIVVVLARQLGPVEFGLAALAMVAPLVLSVAVTSGLHEAVVQRPELEPIHLDSVFWLLLAVGASLTALIWLSAIPIAAALDEPRLVSLIRWTSLIVVMQSLGSVPAAVLKRALDFRLFAIRTMVGTGIGGTLGIVLALSGFGVLSLVSMHLCTVVVEAAILLGLGPWRPRFRFSFARCHDLLDFSGPVVIQSLWYLANDELPKVIMGSVAGTQAVGVFAFARRPLELLTQCFLGPVTAMTMPVVSRLQSDPVRANRFFVRAVRVSALISFPVFFGFAAIAPEAVPLIFGAQWTDAVFAVQILMLLGLFRTVTSPCGLSLLAMGHSRLLLKVNVLYTLLLLLTLPVAAQFGLEVAVAGLVLCNLALLPVFLRLAKYVGGIDVKPALATFPRLGLCGVLMFVAVDSFRGSAANQLSDLLQLICQVGVGAITFAAAAALLLPGELRAASSFFLRLRH